MTPPSDNGEDDFHTLIEAREKLVDPDLLKAEWLAIEAVIRHGDQEFADYPKNLLSLNPKIVQAFNPKIVQILSPRRACERSEELRKAAETKEGLVDEQFHSRLSRCRLFAREAKPTAPLVEIPAVASLMTKGSWSSQLQILSIENNQLIFRPRPVMSFDARRVARIRGDDSIIYFDVGVVLPGYTPPKLEKRTAEVSSVPRNVSNSDLAEFLFNSMHGLKFPDAELSQDNMWKAALHHFKPRKVSRQRVRDWIHDHAPQEKRFSRGEKSRKAGA